MARFSVLAVAIVAASLPPPHYEWTKTSIRASEDGDKWRNATERAGWFPRGGASLAVLDDRLWLLGGKTGVSSNSNPQDIWFMTRIRS